MPSFVEDILIRIQTGKGEYDLRKIEKEIVKLGYNLRLAGRDMLRMSGITERFGTFLTGFTSQVFKSSDIMQDAFEDVAWALEDVLEASGWLDMFADLLEWIAELLEDNPWIGWVLGLTFLIGIIVIVASKLLALVGTVKLAVGAVLSVRSANLGWKDSIYALIDAFVPLNLQTKDYLKLQVAQKAISEGNVKGLREFKEEMTSTSKFIPRYTDNINELTKSELAHFNIVSGTTKSSRRQKREFGKSRKGMQNIAKVGLVAAGAIGGMVFSFAMLQPIMEVLAPIFESIGEAFATFFEPLEPVIDAIADWIEENPQLFVGLVSVLGIIALLVFFLPTLMNLFGGTAAAGGALGGALTTISGMSAGAFAGIASIIAAVAGLVGSFALFVKWGLESGASISDLTVFLTAGLVEVGIFTVALLKLISGIGALGSIASPALTGIAALVAAFAGVIGALAIFVKFSSEAGASMESMVGFLTIGLAEVTAFAIALGILTKALTSVDVPAITGIAALVAAFAGIIGALALIIKWGSEAGHSLEEIGQFMLATMLVVTGLSAGLVTLLSVLNKLEPLALGSVAGVAALMAAFAGLFAALAALAGLASTAGLELDQIRDFVITTSAAITIMVGALVVVLSKIGEISPVSLGAIASVAALIAAFAGLFYVLSIIAGIATEANIPLTEMQNFLISLSTTVGILVGALTAVVGLIGSLSSISVGTILAVAGLVGAIALIIYAMGDLVKIAAQADDLNKVTEFINNTFLAVGLLVGVLSALAAILGTVTGGIGALAIAALAGLVAAFGYLIYAMSDFVKSIVYFAKNWKKVAKVILEIGPTILKGIERTVDEILRILDERLPEWIELFAQALKKIAAAISEHGPAIAEAFTVILDSVSEIISAFISGLVDLFGEMLVSLADSIRENAVEVIRAFDYMIQEITRALGNLAIHFVEVGAEMITNILTGIGDAAEQIADEFVDVATKVGDSIGSMISIGTDIIVDIVQGIGEAIYKIGMAIAEIIPKIGEVILLNLEVLSEYGGQIIEAIAEGITDNISKVKSGIADVIWHIITGCPGGGLKDFECIGTKYGEKLGVGIADGITSNVRLIEHKVADVIDTIEKDPIISPVHRLQIATGIDYGEIIPTPVGGIAGAGGEVSTGDVFQSISITIQQAPGESPEEMAEEVARILRRELGRR